MSKRCAGFVGAGLVPALRKGTHEGCPYKMARRNAVALAVER